jgi:hypothetical protein
MCLPSDADEPAPGETRTGKEVVRVSATCEAVAASTRTRFEYKVVDTGKDVEAELNALGTGGWQVVGVTTKKQLFIAPPQAIILMREVQPTG